MDDAATFPSLAGLVGFGVTYCLAHTRKEALLDILAYASRLPRQRVHTAPAGLDFGNRLSSPSKHRLEECTFTANLVQPDMGDYPIMEECGLSVRYLMLYGDPEMNRDHLGGRDTPPMRDDGILHPAEIYGVIDVSHEIDVFVFYGDIECVKMRKGHSG